MLASDKHSSLLGRFVKYSLKKFHNIYTKGQRNKTFYGRNLQMGQIQFFQHSVLFAGKASGLYYKSFRIVIYDRNDSTIVDYDRS